MKDVDNKKMILTCSSDFHICCTHSTTFDYYYLHRGMEKIATLMPSFFVSPSPYIYIYILWKMAFNINSRLRRDLSVRRCGAREGPRAGSSFLARCIHRTGVAVDRNVVSNPNTTRPASAMLRLEGARSFVLLGHGASTWSRAKRTCRPKIAL